MTAHKNILDMINALPAGKDVIIPDHASVMVDGEVMAPWGEQSEEDKADFLASCTEIQVEYVGDSSGDSVVNKVYQQNSQSRVMVAW